MRTSDAVQAGAILGCGMVMTCAGHVLRRSQDSGDPSSLETLLGLGLSGLGLTVVGWWVLTLLVALLAEAVLRCGPSAAARLAQRCSPALMRRLASALLGVNLLAAPAMAQAAPAVESAMVGSSVATGTDVTRGAVTATSSPYWSLRPVVARDRAPEARTRATNDEERIEPVSPAWRPAPIPADGGVLLRTHPRSVVDDVDVAVAPGDSLWSIVGAHLGPLATAADIAEAWPAWYNTNKSVIGDDPSFLIPGQVLKAPPA